MDDQSGETKEEEVIDERICESETEELVRYQNEVELMMNSLHLHYFSRQGTVFVAVCLSVYPHDISKIDHQT